MKVADLMTTDVVTVGPEHNVADVASFMVSRGIGSVLVVEDQRILGILTERDVLKIVGAGDDPKVVAAHEALTDELLTVAPDTSVEQAAQVMVESGVRHLPVVSGQGVEGIISIRDLVRWSAQEAHGGNEGSRVELSRQVLSLVHPPVTPSEQG